MHDMAWQRRGGEKRATENLPVVDDGGRKEGMMEGGRGRVSMYSLPARGPSQSRPRRSLAVEGREERGWGRQKFHQSNSSSSTLEGRKEGWLGGAGGRTETWNMGWDGRNLLLLPAPPPPWKEGGRKTPKFQSGRRGERKKSFSLWWWWCGSPRRKSRAGGGGDGPHGPWPKEDGGGREKGWVGRSNWSRAESLNLYALR